MHSCRVLPTVYDVIACIFQWMFSDIYETPVYLKMRIQIWQYLELSIPRPGQTFMKSSKARPQNERKAQDYYAICVASDLGADMTLT